MYSAFGVVFLVVRSTVETTQRKIRRPHIHLQPVPSHPKKLGAYRKRLVEILRNTFWLCCGSRTGITTLAKQEFLGELRKVNPDSQQEYQIPRPLIRPPNHQAGATLTHEQKETMEKDLHDPAAVRNRK